MEIASTFDKNWHVFQNLFPKNWQAKAYSTGAVTRQLRNFDSVETVMRILLIHIANGYSLKETSVRAEKSNLAQVSDVALLKRLRCSEMWFKRLCCDLLEEAGTNFSKKSHNIKMRIVDASIVKEPGKTGGQWRIHYSLCLPDLCCDYFELTSNKGKGTGESFSHFPISEKDCIIGDRGYSNNNGIHYVAQNKGYSLVRVNTGSLVIHGQNETDEDKPYDLMSVKKLTKALDVGEWMVKIKRTDSTEVVEGRICAIRKTDSAIETAIKKLKQEAIKDQKKLRDESIEYAKYIIVFTSLPKDLFSASEVLELYRVRWQVELAFKRLKSLAGLGHLPKHDEQSSRAWLFGKLFVGLMVEKVIRHAGALSPWGYEFEEYES